MSKQIMKPVWRVNSGNGVPSDLGGSYLIFNNGAIDKSFTTLFYWNHLWDVSGFNFISAYQTNRTKAAKYERVECGVCIDSQFNGLVYCGGYFEFRKCPHCNGTGKVWEYAE